MLPRKPAELKWYDIYNKNNISIIYTLIEVVHLTLKLSIVVRSLNEMQPYTPLMYISQTKKYKCKLMWEAELEDWYLLTIYWHSFHAS